MTAKRVDTMAWRRLKARVKAEEQHCGLCGGILNHQLPKTSPNATQIDHITPLALGGPLLDRANVRAVHRRCHGRRPNPWFQLPATRRGPDKPNPIRSRNW